MKLGICTGGGDCPGLNAAIRAIVKHAVGSYQWEVIGIHQGMTGLRKSQLGFTQLPLSRVTGILSRGGTILGTSNKGTPFKDPQSTAKVRAELEEGWQEIGLDALIVIGGDGTQSMARQLIAMGKPVVGIPKTIDNDLTGTEQTIGFSTAVDIATEAATRLQSTAESHDRIMILEVMGRDSGYIALHSGIAGGANVVLLPEIPFDYDAIIAKLEQRKKLGRSHSLIVAAEGACAAGSEPVFKKSADGKVNLGGIGALVAKELTDRTEMETRVTVLGHIQRGGAPNASDKILATQFGVAAVEQVAQKKFGQMVVLKDGRVQATAYKDLSEGRQKIALDSSIITSAEAIGICLGRQLSFQTSS